MRLAAACFALAAFPAAAKKGTTQILPDLLDGRVDMALDSLLRAKPE